MSDFDFDGVDLDELDHKQKDGIILRLLDERDAMRARIDKMRPFLRHDEDCIGSTHRIGKACNACDCGLQELDEEPEPK